MDDIQYKSHYEAAHDYLDWMGVPREDINNQKLTVSARIEWIDKWFPLLKDAIPLIREEERKHE